MIGTNTRGARLGSGIVSGIGDVAGNSILAGMLSKSAPVAVATGIGTALLKIYSIFFYLLLDVD